MSGPGFCLRGATRCGLMLFAAVAGCTAPLARDSASSSHPEAPVAVILDTDIGTDVDDAGALAMLHALADGGEARILAVMSCNRSPWSARAIDVINTYYGRPEIPVGSTRTGPDDEIWYRDAVPRFRHRLVNNPAPEAVGLYRRVLADQPDRSVTIVAVGWLTNLAELLRSGPDEISPLTGRDLVLAKVSKLVAMGGIWPNTQGQGEYNFTMDRPAAQTVVRDWPGAITFTGLGVDVMTGRRLMAEAPADNPVRVFYGRYFAANQITERASWDQVAVLYGVRGLRGYFTAADDGRCVILEDGNTGWKAGESHTGHAYLEYAMPQPQLAEIIEDLMLRPPRRAGK